MTSETSPSPSTEGTQLSENLILDTPISSNPPSSPSGTDILTSPSSKVHSPSIFSVDPTTITHRDDNTRRQGIGVTVDSPMVAKEGTDVHPKEGSDLSTKTLFEGGLIELKEGPSNILQRSKPDTGEGNCLFVQESGESSSQKAPPVVPSPKWDGTPTLSDVEAPKPTTPSGTAEGTSSLPDDDEVPIHLVFKRKSRSASIHSIQGPTGTKGVTTATVLDEEDQSSPIVDLDTEVPSQVMEESPKVEKKSLHSAKVSKKGKQLSVVEKPAEVPGDPVQKSKKKHFIEKVSKGKRIVSKSLEGDVKERAANIMKQKEENASLKSDNAALRKQLEDLTQRMIRDRRATNERIDKLLSKL
ncbi:hypothetical protein HAX54_005612 [Datura stramonium]|uniref:Uncharacterized protein n=1 Tax=Datura stramonium TaxID=4076 RepID=A0ABS8TA92_DATST|nr:hypothetical protein [Datura stramonium]